MSLLRRRFAKIICIAALLVVSCGALDAQPASPAAKGGMSLAWSTLLGGPHPCIIRGMTTDAAGCLYVTGMAGGTGFPTTPGAYQRTFGGGESNAFVAKIDPDGRIVWSTLFGGEGAGECYAGSIALDGRGNVYIAGRTNPGLRVTPGVFQPKFQGISDARHGAQNGFVAKLTPDGAHLLWASYLGTGDCVSDISVDSNGDVYAGTWYEGAKSPAPPPSEWFTGGFQRKPETGSNLYLLKIKSDGSRVLAGTYLTAPGARTGPFALGRDAAGNVYVAMATTAPKMPTYNGFEKTHRGDFDLYVAKLSPDLARIQFGTYLGGPGTETAGAHHLVVDAEGNAYVAMTTNSAGLPTTPGAIQRQPADRRSDNLYVAKISPDGSRLLGGTYFGGTGAEYGCDGLAVDREGNVYVGFTTVSTDLRPTPGAAQKSHAGGASDAFLAKISADFTTLLYGTYLGGSGQGGSGWDEARSVLVDGDGNAYFAGDTSSADFPTRNAPQDVLAGAENGFLAKFVPASVPGLKLKTNSAEYQAPASVVMTATPDAGPGTIARVEFRANGRLVGSCAAAPWTFTWKDAPAGGYFLEARAEGDLDATSPSNTAEITVSGGANLAPAIIVPAVARPSPVDCLRANNMGEAVNPPVLTTLSVTAADDGGEAALTYAWKVAAKPPGAADPVFVANGTNEAKRTTATFSAAGEYEFEVTVKDAWGLAVTSSVRVTVLSVR